MNYRHAYHAGNFADVAKHVIVTRIVEYLKRKEAAFRVIDTHAGIGRYDLLGTEAGKTAEWQGGIGRLMNASIPEAAMELLAPYLEAVRSENTGAALQHYPGSPLLVRKLLRKQDRLSAIELHEEDARTLGAVFAGDYQTRVIHLDGWLALGAHVPPKEKRGLVLIDPPFEQPDEFGRLVAGLEKAHRRFSGGTYALWYPIKALDEVEHFIEALRATGIPKIMNTEMMIRATSSEPRLDGTGMIIVNPPYTLESELETLLPLLTKMLADGKGGSFSIDWINGE
ncbi:MAG: 23S rRNA (adenine(2030)-N(6))-methyltransferase RlmJ [Phyllobacterium sp.]